MSLSRTAYDGFSMGEYEQERLCESCCVQNVCCKKEPLSEYSSTPSSQNEFKAFKTGILCNTTIKWKGNNRKLFTILFIILQILLTMTLLGKIGTRTETQMHPKITKIVLESKKMTTVNLDDLKNTKVTEKHHVGSLHHRPTSYSPVEKNECLPITAFSVNELQQKMADISEQSSICLTINFNGQNGWNLTNSSIKVEMVKEITLVGCIDMVGLASVLEKFNHAYKITFGQTSNEFCDNNNNQCMHRELHDSLTSEKYLLNLNEVVLENFNCKHIFQFLSQTFYMNAVKSMKIRNIEVDQNNIMGMRQLLKQYKYSLENLHFDNVTWKVSLFSRSSNQLPNLKELHIDFVSAAEDSIDFLRGFNAASHLLKIVSMRGYLPYSQFSSLLKFKMLSNVTLGVDIPTNVTTIDLFPVNSLPSLKYMELFLNFESITKCYLLSDYDIERPYITKLNSNCDEIF